MLMSLMTMIKIDFVNSTLKEKFKVGKNILTNKIIRIENAIYFWLFLKLMNYAYFL